MTTVFLSPIGNDAPFMRNGVPASGCKLFTYTSGSTTKANTYTDNTGNIANANPIILNSEGYPASGGNVISIWLTQGVTYKFVLAPSTDTDPPSSSIWSRDNISGIDDVSLSQSEWVSGPIPTFVSSTQFTLAGDQTSIFHVGRAIQATVTAGTSYGTVTASAFSVVTTVTVDTQGSNALDSGLSAVKYGLISAANFSQSLRLDAVTRYATAIAAAASLNLNAVGGDQVHIATSTATTTITSVTLAQGHKRRVTLESPQVFVQGSSLILPNNSKNITGFAGDSFEFSGEPSNIVRCTDYMPASGPNALVRLDSKTASSSAQLDFTSSINSLFDVYRLQLVNIIPATNGARLGIRISEDGGSTFKSGAGDYVEASNGENTVPAILAQASSGVTLISLAESSGGISSTAGRGGISGLIEFYAPSSSSVDKHFNGNTTYVDGSGNYCGLRIMGAYKSDQNAINAVRLIMSSGNIASGSAYLYGVMK